MVSRDELVQIARAAGPVIVVPGSAVLVSPWPVVFIPS